MSCKVFFIPTIGVRSHYRLNTKVNK